MRRRLSILTLICCSLLCTMVGIGGVRAGTISGGYTGVLENSGSGNGGGSISFYTTPIAFGYRVTIIDSNGAKAPNTHSFDYWSSWGSENAKHKKGYQYLIDKNNRGYVGQKTIRYYSEKNPKTVSNRGNFTTSTDNYPNQNSDKDKLVPDYVDKIGNGIINEKIAIPGSNNGGDTHYNNNYAKFALIAMQKAMEEEKYEYFINMFKSCGFTGSDQEILSTASNYYLLVEPLSALSRSDITDKSFACLYGADCPIVYIGTVYDLYKMGFYNGASDYLYDYFSYINPIIYNTKRLAGINGCSSNPNPNAHSNMSTNLSSNGCSGAFVVELSDLAPDCPTQVKNAYKDYRENKINASNYNSKVAAACDNDSGCFYLKVDNTNGYSAYGIDPSSIKSCDMPTCNDVAKQKITSTNLILKETIKNLLTKLLKENQTLKEPSKDGSVSNMFVYKYGLTGNSKLCDPNSCSNILSGIQNNKTLTEEQKRGKVGLLYNLFKNSGLDVSLLDEANYGPDGMDKKVSELTCKGIPPGCTGSSSGDCSTGSLTFSDTTSEECIKYGIAYYDKNKSHLQSSKSSTYSSENANVYCKEEVKFDLPQGISNHIKAGTMLKWGKDADSGLFGTMTITRTCYNEKGSSRITDIDSIDTSWAQTQYINTQIQIIYDDPTENYSLTNYIDSPKLNGDVYVSGTIKEFVITANYDFYYGNNFKWYSDKGDTFKAVNYNETDKKADNSTPKENYVEIGYGLPTSFTTPEGILNGTLNGGLTAVISNIGTYTGSGYHFDKYVTYNIDDDSKLNNGIKYSCEFYIENELFGNECYDENGKAYDGGPDYCKPDTSPEGIDVAFRTIDLMDSDSADELDRAFPGMSGTGITGGNRKMGANWDKVYSVDDGATQIFNILSNSIYSKEPLYWIKLNVPLIQSIRNYNKTARKNGYDPYTNMADEQEINDGKNATSSSGYLGYKFGNDNSAYSAFLWYLSHDCTNEGKKCLIDNYKCITNKNANRSGCRQEWWNEE